MSLLRIGTCSWKYDSWAGFFYSSKNPTNYLREYARQLDTVEVDQWFWSLFGENEVLLPKTETVQEYIESVPEGFKFSIKVPNSLTLTHFYRKSKYAPLIANPHFLSLELFSRFLEKLDPMKPYLGPLMFQFEYLNREKMPSQGTFQQKFSQFIRQCPKDYAYALEVRNPNYLNKNYFSFLHTHKLIPVLLQGYFMPPIFELHPRFTDDMGEQVVIRLHGTEREQMEKKSGGKWDTIIEDRETELKSVVELLWELAKRRIQVYLNVNNHYEGSAPLTIQRIRDALHGRSIRVPHLPSKEQQLDLF